MLTYAHSVQAAVAKAALDLTAEDPAMIDSGVAFFRPPMDYKFVDWLLVQQEVLRYNESSGRWQCDYKGVYGYVIIKVCMAM